MKELIEQLHKTKTISTIAHAQLLSALDKFPLSETSPDGNVEKNRQMLLERSIVGLKKYGTTTERTDLNLSDWLHHAIEEVLDLANYLQAIKTSVEANCLTIVRMEQIGEMVAVDVSRVQNKSQDELDE